MTRAPLKIATVERPLPRGSMWSGKAATARRKYDWFYSANDDRVVVMANRPNGSNWYWHLRYVPAAFKAEIKRAVAAAKGAV